LEEGSLTQEELARRIGRSRATITNALRLLDLPLAIQRLLVEGGLSAGHGKALLGLAGSPFQERLARRAAHEPLSVRETEELVRRYQAISANAAPRQGSRSGTRPAIAGDVQRRLAAKLRTRVRIDLGKRKGKIVVDFASVDDLERIAGIVLDDGPGAEPITVVPE
jgi:ParB family chromosome partitioning protein